MALSVGDKVGPYEILAPLGAGGMGEVYRAHDSRLGRHVAVKALPPHLVGDALARERLRREALAVAALDHPFICKVFEIGEADGALFIVMEYVSGVTLRARLATGRVPLSEALRIAGEMAEALQEAHEKHFVHRDLKPANVMLTSQGRVKVMDFGLAKRSGIEVSDPTISALTQEGAMVGTPKYMSPEQVKGEMVDARSDLFSFGIVLCELLGGDNPFQRATTLETVTAILRDPPKLPDNLPQGLIVVIRRLLAKAPAERYQSMKEVRTDLARVTAAPASEQTPAEEQMPLIGRDSERAELLRALDQAMAGHGSVVMIGGEPGVGKTHLTRAVLEEGRRRGAFAAVGHCYEMEGSPPYVPFVEILEYAARVAPPESFRYAVGDAAPEIAKIVPELRRIFPDIPEPVQLPPEQQRRLLFNAYRDFCERAARATPLVSVFEDLHWADEPTLLLLQHVAQTIPTVPSLLIGTYRDVELDVDRPFANALETLTRERLATRIALRRLKIDGVEAMLRAMSGQEPPPQLARIVFAETEGNPFFVEEVFRHLCEEGKLFDASGGWKKDLRFEQLEVPEGVRLVIGKRLKRLSHEARHVLTTAAVIGRTFCLRLLEELENARPDGAIEAMEEAERAHLVGPERSGRELNYRFTHELIRQTLADSVSMPKRQRLHARIGAAMEEVFTAALDKHVPAIAHHLYQAGAVADAEKTLAYLLRAADAARRSAAHEEALTHLDNAMSLLDGESGVTVADVHGRRADVLRSLQRLPEAMAAYEQAIAGFAAAGEPVRAASACVPLAYIQGWAYDLSDANRTVQRALDLTQGASEPLMRVRLLSLKGALCAEAGHAEDGLRVLAEAEPLFTAETPADVYLTHAWGHHHAADFRRSLEFWRKAVEANGTTRDLWLEAEIGLVPLLVRFYTGPPAEPKEVQPILDSAIRMGHEYTIFVFRSVLDAAAASRGELSAAERSATETIVFAKAFRAGGQYVGHFNLGVIHDLQGRDEEMLDSFGRAFECEPASFLRGISPAAQFRVRAIRGDEGSLELLRHDSISMPVPGRWNRQGAWWAMAWAVEGLAALGRREEAAALHQVAEELLLLGAEFAWLWPVRTAAGIAAACAQDWSRAEEHHRVAIQLTDTSRLRALQPFTRAWYAEMLAARGDLAGARAMLAEALALYEAVGMPGYARRASERLATL